MMAALHIEPSDTSLDDEIADLWRDGFDSLDIAEVLASDGHLNARGGPIAEADVCMALERQREERRSDRARGAADA